MQLYRAALQDKDLDLIQALVTYIINRVVFTVTTSSNVATSLKFFSVSTQRGKQLQPIYALKGYVFHPAGIRQEKQARVCAWPHAWGSRALPRRELPPTLTA